MTKNHYAPEYSLLQSPQQYLCYNLDHDFDRNFTGRWKWSNVPMFKVLMSLIRKRPRDLVKLCSLAAHEAHLSHSTVIRAQHLEEIFEEYSQGRIQDTINEYRSELSNIEHLIFGMKPTKKGKVTADSFVFTTIELQQKINNIMQQNRFILATVKNVTWKELAQFLFKINFITARKQVEDGEILRKYFQENRYLSSSFVDFGYDWEIHPSFRWVLQPYGIHDILNKLSLSADS